MPQRSQSIVLMYSATQLNYSDFRLNYSDEHDKYTEPVGAHERTFGGMSEK